VKVTHVWLTNSLVKVLMLGSVIQRLGGAHSRGSIDDCVK